MAPAAASWSDEVPSSDALRLLDWVARTGDHGGKPFVVIDKRAARLYVFDERAALKKTSRVLLGAAVGDDSAPDVGEKPMDQVKPHERTTPAGRFVARPGRNHRGEDVIWVDHAAAVSMHRVRLVDPAERRLQRLASAVAADRRISYGCINVPAAFFDQRLRTVFARGPALVYVLPEVRALHEVFDLGPDPQAADSAADQRDAIVNRHHAGHGLRQLKRPFAQGRVGHGALERHTAGRGFHLDR